MNFFNASWLVGLFSLLIPILLHLQKRKLKTIDWAAVRFLKSSLVNKTSWSHARKLLSAILPLSIACGVHLCDRATMDSVR